MGGWVGGWADHVISAQGESWWCGATMEQEESMVASDNNLQVVRPS